MVAKQQIRQGLLVAATLAMAAVSQIAVAQDEDRLYWGVRGTFTNYSWSNLGDIQPLSGGPFEETTGSGIESRLSASFGRWGPARLVGGMELGLVDFGVGDSPLISLPNARLNALSLDYFAATLSFRFGNPGGHYVEIDSGLAAYAIDSKYVDCFIRGTLGCPDSDAKSEGVFLGVTGMLGPGILLGARVHLVDFDPIESVDLGVTPFDGPIYSFFIGYEFSNWWYGN